MKTLQSFYVTLLIGTFIAYISCSKFPVDEIEVYEYQPAEPTNEVKNAIASVLKTVEKLESKNDFLPRDFLSMINDHTVRNSLKSLDGLMSIAINDHSTDAIHEVIDKLAGVNSPFQRFPTIAAPILLALPTFVESFMNDKAASRSRKQRLPCNLADTIEMYFMPTLLRRLIHVNVEADSKKFPSHSKYSVMNAMAKQKFDPTVSSYDDNRDEGCEIGSGGNDGYQSAIQPFGGWKLAYITNDGQAHDSAIAIEDEYPYAFMKDGLANYNTYYKDNNIAKGSCKSYFSMVRARLEKAFGEAYKKVEKLCPPESRNRAIKPTGRGLLTITLGSYLAKGLPNGDSCDSRENEKKFCDPYVKITVGDTVYETKEKTNAPGWISVDETYNFPNLDRNAKVHIDIIDKDEVFNNDDIILSQDFSINDLLGNFQFKDKNYNLLLVSTWKDEVADPNFTSLVYSKN